MGGIIYGAPYVYVVLHSAQPRQTKQLDTRSQVCLLLSWGWGRCEELLTETCECICMGSCGHEVQKSVSFRSDCWASHMSLALKPSLRHVAGAALRFGWQAIIFYNGGEMSFLNGA